MNDITLINDAIKKHRELLKYYDAIGCKDDVLVQERYIRWLSELREYKGETKRKGYRQYSDSTLMSLPKRKIIELLRVAEHNYFVTVEALNNSAKAGRELAEKLDKHGKWSEQAIRTTSRGVDEIGYYCSECGYFESYTAKYCAGCGAKMDGGKENDL